jgi:Do/DeqQ family serine protease
MRKLWLIFSQAVTVAVAVVFVVATLKPQWLQSRGWASSFSVLEAGPNTVGAGGVGAVSFSQAARVAMPAVVSISAQKAAARNPHANDPAFKFFFGDRGERDEPQVGLGSGVIVSPDGYLLTNHHVIEGADEVFVQLADGREARAQIVGTDPDTDLAVLKIDLKKLPVMALGDSTQLQVGDPVMAIGNPFNVGQTATSGIVSALGRNQLGLSTFENFIQTDAAINPGNSGGALVDARGALVGINTAIYSESGGSLGIGFAVPIDLAREVMQALVDQGRVVRGWVGVEPRDLTPEITEALGLGTSTGVLITGVLQNGPASTAGLQPGDVVTRVGDLAVTSTGELLRAVASLKPKSKVAVTVLRSGKSLTLNVTVAQRPSASAPRR